MMKIVLAFMVCLTLSSGDETAQHKHDHGHEITNRMLNYQLLRLQCLDKEGLYNDIPDSMTYGDLLKLDMKEGRNICKALCIMQARLDKILLVPAESASPTKCKSDVSSYCERTHCLLEEKFGSNLFQQNIEGFVHSIFKEIEKGGGKTVDPKVWQDYKIRNDTLLNSAKTTSST